MDNSKHCDGSKPPLLQRVSSLWNTFLVKVLGLTPIPDAKKTNGTQDQSDAEFDTRTKALSSCSEYLCIFPPHHAPCSSNRCQVRNRFASSNSVGGYRDINFKIRVGLKCDSKKGRPLFCSVSVAPRWAFDAIASCASSHGAVQEALAAGGCEDNGATLTVCFVAQCDM